MGQFPYLALAFACAGLASVTPSVSAAVALPTFQVVNSLDAWTSYFSPTQVQLQDFSSVQAAPLQPGPDGNPFSTPAGDVVLSAQIDGNDSGSTAITQSPTDKYLSVWLCDQGAASGNCTGANNTRSLLFRFPSPINGFLADWDSTTNAASLNFAAYSDGDVVGTVSFGSYLSSPGAGTLGIVASSSFDTLIFGLDKPSLLLEAFTVDDVRTGVVPLPTALPLFASALFGVGLIGWRSSRRSA